MRILLVNDDGIDAVGMHTLMRGLADKHEVYAVAPDRQRSAVSKAMTLSSPLRAKETATEEPVKAAFAVDGMPVDCVRLGLGNLVPEPELGSVDIRPGDRLLLCSDGLSDLLLREELAEVLAAISAPGRAAEELFLRAMERGGKDNITVLLVQYPDEMTGE